MKNKPKWKNEKKGMPPVVRKDGKFQNGVEGGEVKASLKQKCLFTLLWSAHLQWFGWFPIILIKHSEFFFHQKCFLPFFPKEWSWDITLAVNRPKLCYWTTLSCHQAALLTQNNTQKNLCYCYFVIEQLSPVTKLLCWLRISPKKILFIFVIRPTNALYVPELLYK